MRARRLQAIEFLTIAVSSSSGSFHGLPVSVLNYVICMEAREPGIIDAKPAQHFGSRLSQQRGGTAHYTWCPGEVHGRCNVCVLSNHGMLELGKEAYLVEVLVRCQVVGIAGHADRAAK